MTDDDPEDIPRTYADSYVTFTADYSRSTSSGTATIVMITAIIIETVNRRPGGIYGDPKEGLMPSRT